MKERQDTDQSIVPGEVVQAFHLADVGDQIVVREHHTLRQSRGTAGVGQHDEILARVDVNCRRFCVVVEQEGEGSGALCFAKDEYLFDARGLRRRASFIDELWHRNQESCPSIVKLVSDLFCGVEGVDRSSDSAERGYRVKR